MSSGKLLVSFYHADKPVFTLDCRYLLYVDAGRTLITYCLQRMAPVHYLACDAEHLLVLPVKHHVVVMTSGPPRSPRVALWDFHDGRRLLSLDDVAAGGIQDVSKDGALAVDADLRVFDLDTGQMTSRIDHAVDAATDKEFVRLTDDGEYVVWLDKSSVKVGRVSDGALVGHACTHERPTSLSMLDCGYVLVVGREDGRILMMKLVADDGPQPRAHSADERCTAIHGRQTCSEEARSAFDAVYRRCAQPVRDGDLPRASESIRAALGQRAKAPLLTTATPKSPDSAADKYRRSYSQLPPMMSPALSCHDIARSTDDLSTAGTGDEGDLMRRSHSVTDILAGCTLHAASPAPTHKHKFLGCLWDFGATLRNRRKKYRRRVPAETDARDRMPSV